MNAPNWIKIGITQRSLSSCFGEIVGMTSRERSFLNNLINECFYIVVSHPREKLLRGPDVLTAMGSFPLPPCTDVHQVLIPRSHTRTSNICTDCTTRHIIQQTQIQIDISAPKHGHAFEERVP